MIDISTIPDVNVTADPSFEVSLTRGDSSFVNVEVSANNETLYLEFVISRFLSDDSSLASFTLSANPTCPQGPFDPDVLSYGSPSNPCTVATSVEAVNASCQTSSLYASAILEYNPFTGIVDFYEYTVVMCSVTAEDGLSYSNYLYYLLRALDSQATIHSIDTDSGCTLTSFPEEGDLWQSCHIPYEAGDVLGVEVNFTSDLASLNITGSRDLILGTSLKKKLKKISLGSVLAHKNYLLKCLTFFVVVRYERSDGSSELSRRDQSGHAVSYGYQRPS